MSTHRKAPWQLEAEAYRVRRGWPVSDVLSLEIPMPNRRAPTPAETSAHLTLSDVVSTKANTGDHVTLLAVQGGSRFGVRIEHDAYQVYLDVEGEVQALPEATVGRNLLAHVRGLLLHRSGPKQG